MAKENATTEACDVRWLTAPDRPQVLAIEARSFNQPLTDEELTLIARQEDCTRLVAVRRGRRHDVIGYLFYWTQADRYDVCRLAVRPDARRSGVGRSLLAHLKAKVGPGPYERPAIYSAVPEPNLAGQVFLRACGLRCVRTLDVQGTPTYVFRFPAPEPGPAS